MNKVIKAELKTPYTEEQRLDFIVNNNHQLGYLIEESKDALQAYINEKTPEEVAQEKEYKINHLTMTALDFVNYIKELGLTDAAIVAYLQSNPSAQLKLTLCSDVYCGVVRQLCPLKITETLTLTDEMVVAFFKNKHKLD